MWAPGVWLRYDRLAYAFPFLPSPLGLSWMPEWVLRKAS